MEGQGTDGVLTLANLSKEDAGRYKCSSETEAGVSQTPEALLVVKGTSMSCSFCYLSDYMLKGHLLTITYQVVTTDE